MYQILSPHSSEVFPSIYERLWDYVNPFRNGARVIIKSAPSHFINPAAAPLVTLSHSWNYYHYLLLYTSGDVSNGCLISEPTDRIARKPEETCREGYLQCEPATLVNPFSSMIKCSGFFYMHLTILAHGTYALLSHPKDNAYVVKYLA